MLVVSNIRKGLPVLQRQVQRRRVRVQGFYTSSSVASQQTLAGTASASVDATNVIIGSTVVVLGAVEYKDSQMHKRKV